MYIFIFIYVYVLKKIIDLLNGNYINSLSSLFFIINLYAPTDNYLDLILITLSFVSSIHHSIRHLYRTKFNKFIQNCDSGVIAWLSSYLFLNKLNFYPKIISFIICLFVIIVEFFYNLKNIKKIVVLITFLYIIYLNPIFLFFILLSLFFFFNSDKWDKNNIYRYGWHFTSSFTILIYLLLLFR